MFINTYTHKSQMVYYKGHVLDSLLELKYVLTIEDTHAWLRDGLEIYYDLEKLTPGLKEHLNCYRPDFLIRNWQTVQAELIELKPAGFCDDNRHRNRRITSECMAGFAYDWNYHYVYGSQINLSDDQQQKFRDVLRTQGDWRHKPCIHLLQNTSTLSDTQYREFVMTGRLPASIA
ncbi:MAG: hypothetical protein J0H85_13705 [Sediminibacterium magnilacihabitans]|nr:hypothetical protein [Sediminibacterium magnilacihabitans]PQV59484.1 hypothetical protein CLV53_11845 [Sediminibacterium magnilacihabitans]